MYQVGDTVRVHNRYFVIVAFTATGAAVLRDDENSTLTRYL